MRYKWKILFVRRIYFETWQTDNHYDLGDRSERIIKYNLWNTIWFTIILYKKLAMYFVRNEMVYNLMDTVVNTLNATNYPVDFLNLLKRPCLKYQRLTLRVGTHFKLLQNLKIHNLCNRPRLKVKASHRNIVEAKILTHK